MARVGLVFVSHSAKIAEGLVDVARQMAPTAALAAAGGRDDGGIGTSFERIETAIRAVDRGDGVAVIGDLGSAIMTAETVVETLEPPVLPEVRVLDVPLVEGGIAAAVTAESGGDLAAVARAAERAADPGGGGEGSTSPAEATRSSSSAEATVELTDPEGLHARPAAELVRLVGRFRCAVRVNGVDGRSLLAILSLGLRQGSTVRVAAEGEDATEAVDAVQSLLGRGPETL
ncbi:MAG: phosphoenolpyruvate---glycerone phosphotransferase subunit DhaM [Microbacteriaceae bacterium]|nr:phosphoenolpyruvate---glycerone phosphotransferase subunit DhaM [Microbacteriaceae bacterium]